MRFCPSSRYFTWAVPNEPTAVTDLLTYKRPILARGMTQAYVNICQLNSPQDILPSYDIQGMQNSRTSDRGPQRVMIQVARALEHGVGSQIR
jgi:hypothetical protein